MILRGIFIILLTLAALAGAPACQAEPVRIGMSLGLTGKYALYGTDQKRGYLLWQQHVNARGGMLGRPVELIIIDDGSSPERAVQAYQKLIREDHVDLLFSPFSSAITIEVMPLFEQYGYPVAIAGASSDSIWQQGNHHVFGMFLPAGKIPMGFLELLVMSKHERIALLYGDDLFSQDVAAGARKWAAVLGLEIVLDASVIQDDYAGLADQVMHSGAGAVIVSGFLTPAVEMRKALALKSYNGLYYITVGFGVDEFYRELGPLVEGVFSTSQWQWYADRTLRGSLEFVQHFRETYDREDPSYFAATAYAAGEIMEEAVIHAKSLDRKILRNVMAEMNHTTIIGSYGVDSNGAQIRKFNILVQIQNGTAKSVWPAALHEADPILPETSGKPSGSPR